MTKMLTLAPLIYIFMDKRPLNMHFVAEWVESFLFA